jgi:hypothetical protein
VFGLGAVAGRRGSALCVSRGVKAQTEEEHIAHDAFAIWGTSGSLLDLGGATAKQKKLMWTRGLEYQQGASVFGDIEVAWVVALLIANLAAPGVDQIGSIPIVLVVKGLSAFGMGYQQ